MRIPRLLGLLGLTVAIAATSPAQEPKKDPPLPPPKPGAQPGDEVPSSFHSFIVTDTRFPAREVERETGKGRMKVMEADPRDRTGKVHCLVCENGLSPVVAVFVRSDVKAFNATSGVAKLAQRVDKLIPEYRAQKLAGFVMFLRLEPPAGAMLGARIAGQVPSVAPPRPDGLPNPKDQVESLYGPEGKTVAITGPNGKVEQQVDYGYADDEQRDVHAQDVRNLANVVKATHVPFALGPTAGRPVQAFGLTPQAGEVTVVVYYRLRVVYRKSFPATGPTDAEIDAVEQAVRELIDGKPKAPTKD